MIVTHLAAEQSQTWNISLLNHGGLPSLGVNSGDLFSQAEKAGSVCI